jgi:AraC-like DNA-binding protein
MRLAGLDLALHGCDAMSAAHTIREWLTETLEREGLTVERWAQLAGVAKSTIFRALKPDYEFVTSSKTLSKLASAVGAEPPSLLTQVKLAPRFLPVRYVVQAVIVFENDADVPPEQISLAVLPDPRFDRFPQWLEKVVGDSVDLKIAPGSYAHVVDAVELGYAPRHGDWVVVERRRDQGCVRERTIKQVDTQNGEVRLCPRSRNPKWSEPVRLTEGGKIGDIEVEIVGLVIGAYDASF